jgi:hypothetical protein
VTHSYKLKMTGYRKLIVKATGCNPEEAAKVEELMRDVVFHSTLDWQTRDQLIEAARLAYSLYQDREGGSGNAEIRRVSD